MRFASVIILFFFFASCASHEYKVRKEALSLLPEHREKISWRSSGEKSLYVHALEDKRPVKDQIGEVKTGFFRSATPVYIDQPVPYFVKNQFMKALERRNISLVSDETNADISLKGHIEQFWVSEYAPILGKQQALCHLKLDLAMFKKGQSKPRWFGVTWVKVVSPESFWDSSEYTEQVIASCFEVFTKKLLHSPDLRALLGSS